MAEATKVRKDTSEYLRLEDAWSAPNYHPLDVVVERAEGPWVYSVEGKRYLDCLSAYSAVNQGHCHPRILATLREQAARLTLTSRAFRNDQWPLFAKELAELCGMQMVLPMNTGAEAVETAIKAARRWGYRRKGIAAGQAEIIVCRNNFHGRSTTIVGFSSDSLQPRRFRAFHAGLCQHPVRRRGGVRKGDHAEHLRVSGGADPVRGGDFRASRRLPGRGPPDLLGTQRAAAGG